MVTIYNYEYTHMLVLTICSVTPTQMIYTVGACNTKSQPPFNSGIVPELPDDDHLEELKNSLQQTEVRKIQRHI